MGLQDARVLVIGGGSGIGFAVAEGAAALGARVTVAGSNGEKAQAAAARLGRGAKGRGLDVTDEGAVEAFFEAADGYEHVVTTAGDWGTRMRDPLASLDLQAAHATFNVRFWGALNVAKHAGKALSAEGSLTLTNGTVAHKPQKGTAVSTAMAGAIEHLTRALAVELAPVRVNCVCPGLIRTGVWDQLIPANQEETFKALTARQLIKRPGTPEECSQAYLYLMQAGYTTGQVIKVEGGSLLQQ